MTSKEEFQDWRANRVTKQVFNRISERIYNLQIELGLAAGLDVREDAKKVGAIQAYTDLLEIEFEEESHE